MKKQHVFLESGFDVSLAQILQREAPENILLITGNISFDKSPAKTYFEQLAKQINKTRYHGFGNNPQYDELQKALQTLNKTSYDLIIAIGGGSVLDFAKLVKLYLGQSDLLERNFPAIHDAKTMAPMVAIPTTSGSGSEATHFAVVYKDGEKHSIASDEVLPEYVVLDPVLTYSMSRRQTAISGMDALCQAVESVWAVNATKQSKQYAFKALKLLYPNILNAVHNPNPESRHKMQLGAYYAGKAINISKTTGPHALSYYLTEHYGVPHGEAVAMNMEVFIKMNLPVIDKGARKQLLETFTAQDEQGLSDIFSKLKRELGLKDNIASIEINTPEELTKYLDNVNLERLDNNPVKTNINHLRSLMQGFLA